MGEIQTELLKAYEADQEKGYANEKTRLPK
jgi:hypothetical protein